MRFVGRAFRPLLMIVVVAPFTTVVTSSSSSQSYSSSSSSCVADGLADAAGAPGEGDAETTGGGETEGEKEGEGDAEGVPGVVLGTDQDQTQPVAAGFDLTCQSRVIGLSWVTHTSRQCCHRCTWRESATRRSRILHRVSQAIVL